METSFGEQVLAPTSDSGAPASRDHLAEERGRRGRRRPTIRPASPRPLVAAGSTATAVRHLPLPPVAQRTSEPDAPVQPPAPPRSPLVMTAGLFTVSWLCFVAVNVVLRGRPGHVDFAEINDLLTTCGAVAAVVLGTLSVAQWLMGVRARGLAVGVGFSLYGVVVLHVGRLYPLGGGGSTPEVAGYLPAATLLVVFGLIGWNLTTGRELASPWYRVAAALAMTVLALAAGLQLVPALARALAMATLPTPATTGGAVGQLLVAGAWFAVAALSLRTSATGRQPNPAMAIVALGLAQARLALAVAPDGTSVWVLASHAFQLVGLAVALGVVASEFSRRATTQRGQLLDSLVAACTNGARRQARQTIESGYRHDARSALLAVDGAARMLAGHSGQLAEADRATLGRTVGAAVDQLGALIDVQVEEIQDFAVEAVGRSVVQSERRAGRSVTCTVPSDLRGVGRATDLAVVLRTLLRSMWACPGTGGVTLRGERWGVATVLLLGPAEMVHNLHPAADWAIVPANRPGPELGEGGDALELYVAARLMDEQGGDIWTAAHPGGAVSFAVRFPAARPTTEEVIA